MNSIWNFARSSSRSLISRIRCAIVLATWPSALCSSALRTEILVSNLAIRLLTESSAAYQLNIPPPNRKRPSRKGTDFFQLRVWMPGSECRAQSQRQRAATSPDGGITSRPVDCAGGAARTRGGTGALNRPPVELGSVHRGCGVSTMRLASAIAFVLATVLGAMPGHAQTGVALVTSNGGHQNAPVLPNPTNDASGIAASPERLGFSVRRVINGIFDHMRRALRDFAPQARGREMAVVYFAGHGMEIAGENWLIPVDAELKMDIAP